MSARRSAFEIVNRLGLHGRAWRTFAETVAQFQVPAIVSFAGEQADGQSVMELLTLGASQGCVIEVSAEGPDADSCLAALAALIANRFGEEA